MRVVTADLSFVSSFERIDHYIYTLFTHFCLVRSVANSGIIGTDRYKV